MAIKIITGKPGDGMKLIRISRLIGSYVCSFKGCRYHFPGGCFDSWKTYSCIRCGQWSRSFEDTPPRGPGDFDPSDEYQSFEEIEEGERLYQLDTRWFSCLPLPRWL